MTITPNAHPAQLPAVPSLPPKPPVWPTPRPEDTRPFDLWGAIEPPELSDELIPSILRDFVLKTSEKMGCDASGLTMAALTVCAAAIPDSIKVQVAQNDTAWQESARIWTVLVGLPSTKKSPTINAAMRPLDKLDNAAMADWQHRWAIWDALEKAEKKAQPEPLQRRYRIGDTTMEATQEVLRGSTDGILVHADELSGWLGAMDRYSGGGRNASADRAFWLGAWNGGTYALNRVGRGSVLLPNCSASVLGGIQPDAIRRIAGDTVDDGLLQRFFPIVLSPACVAQDIPAGTQAATYDWTVSNLVNLRATGPLRFDNEAHQVRRDLQARLHTLQCGTEIVNRRLAAHIGKLDGYFARLCIVFHLLEMPFMSNAPPFISAHTAETVSRFIRTFLIPHAFAFYGGVLALADDQDRLQAVAGYILTKQLQTVDHRTVQRSVRECRKLTKHDTRPIFDTLAAMNWLTPIWNTDKRSGEPDWWVNSQVHQLFAERAEMETARRLMAQEAIRTLSGQN